jgi:chaperonin cofactor prefoldin
MKINPNLATVDELTQLNGIGPRLAERIIANRPYTTLTDLERVSGIGPSSVLQWQDDFIFAEVEAETEAEENWQEAHPVPDYERQLAYEESTQEIPAEPLLVYEDIPEQETPVEAPPREMVPHPYNPPKALITLDEVPPKPAAPPAHTKQPIKSGFTRGQSWLLTLVACLVTFLLAVGLVLGLVAWLNEGRLRFAAPERVETLAQTLGTVEARLASQESAMEALTARVDNLETLDERMQAAEENIDILYDELDSTTQQLDALGDEVEALQAQVSLLQKQTETFTTFFESLRDMLLDLFPYLP